MTVSGGELRGQRGQCSSNRIGLLARIRCCIGGEGAVLAICTIVWTLAILVVEVAAAIGALVSVAGKSATEAVEAAVAAVVGASIVSIVIGRDAIGVSVRLRSRCSVVRHGRVGEHQVASRRPGSTVDRTLSSRHASSRRLTRLGTVPDVTCTIESIGGDRVAVVGSTIVKAGPRIVVQCRSVAGLHGWSNRESRRGIIVLGLKRWTGQCINIRVSGLAQFVDLALGSCQLLLKAGNLIICSIILLCVGAGEMSLGRRQREVLSGGERHRGGASIVTSLETIDGLARQRMTGLSVLNLLQKRINQRIVARTVLILLQVSNLSRSNRY